MVPHGTLLAWIETRHEDEVVASFIGDGALPNPGRPTTGRAPATQLCSSVEVARQWVHEQAQAFDLPVRWVDGAPDTRSSH
jgi:hypothetical protein